MDPFAIIQAIKDHGIIFTLAVIFGGVTAWFVVRALKKFFSQHEVRLSKIDTLKESISQDERVYTRKEIIDSLTQLVTKFEALLIEVNQRCMIEDCPHHKAMEDHAEDIKREMAGLRKEVAEIEEDTKNVGHELLEFSGVLLGLIDRQLERASTKRE